jgi:phosphonoacetaldehyde hydrolase
VNNPTPDPEIRLVIFDWAGTIVDHGSIAPIAALMAAFDEMGLELSEVEARLPMGLNKRDHIDALLKSSAISDQWFKVFGVEPTSADVDAVYERFLPLQMSAARRRTALIPGVVECGRELRNRGIKMGTTTGYPREIGTAVAESARDQGFDPDHCVYPDDVPSGRPAPFMILRNMELAQIDSPITVVKVGDTVPDIEEGRNATCWSVGVTETGSEIGVSVDEWDALPADEKVRRSGVVETKLLAAGAHAVIPSVAHLPQLVGRLNQRLGRGERP